MKLLFSLLVALFLVGCAATNFDISQCDGDQNDPIWCGSANDGVGGEEDRADDNGDDGEGDDGDGEGDGKGKGKGKK